MAAARLLAVFLAVCLVAQLASCQDTLTLTAASTLTLTPTTYQLNALGAVAANDLVINTNGFALTITANPAGANYNRFLRFRSNAAGSVITFSNSVQFTTLDTTDNGNAVAYAIAAGATVTVLSVTSATARSSITIPATATLTSTGDITFNGPAAATNSIAGTLSATGNIRLDSAILSGNGATVTGAQLTTNAASISLTGGSITTTGTISLTATAGNNVFSGVTASGSNVFITASAGTNSFTTTSATATAGIAISSANGNTFTSGTFTAGTAVTITSSAGTSTYTAGTFTSNINIALSGAIVVNGGTFTAGSGIVIGQNGFPVTVTGGTFTAGTGNVVLRGTVVAVSGGTLTATAGNIVATNPSTSLTISGGSLIINGASSAITFSAPTVTISGGALTASGASASIVVDGAALTVSGGTITSPSVSIGGTTSASLGATTIVSANTRIGPAGAFGSIAHPIAGSTFNFGAGSITFNTPTTFNGVVFVTDQWTVDISATGTPLAGPASSFALTRSSRTINSNLLPAGSGSSCVWVTSTTVSNFLVSLPNDILFRNYVSTNPRALTVSSTNGGATTRCTPLITSTLDRRNDVRQNELVYYGGNAVFFLEVSAALPFGAITAADFSVVGGTATVTQLTPTTYAITVAITCDGIVQVNYLGSVTGTGGNYLGIVATNTGSVVSAKCIANIYAPCA